MYILNIQLSHHKGKSVFSCIFGTQEADVVSIPSGFLSFPRVGEVPVCAAEWLSHLLTGFRPLTFAMGSDCILLIAKNEKNPQKLLVVVVKEKALPK